MWQEELSPIYSYVSNESVKKADEQLQTEFAELKREIETNELVHNVGFMRAFTSVPQPVEPEQAALERKLYLEKILNVHKIRKPYIQADVFFEQFNSASKDEYSNESLPLLLLQVSAKHFLFMCVCVCVWKFNNFNTIAYYY